MWNSNKYYRDGEFRVIGLYRCDDCKVDVMNHLNILLKSCASNLLKGCRPSVRACADKTQYFKNMYYFKFGDDNINDLSQIEYINNRTKIKVVDKDYGEYFITPTKLIGGGKHPKRSNKIASERQKLDKQFVHDKIVKIHPEIEFTLDEYTGVYQYIDVIDKYGVCRITIRSLLKGIKPSIKTALDKSQYFANRAKDVHGDKYDYSLVEYNGNRTKVKIIGPNGTFLTTPGDFLNGVGCPIDGIKRVSNYHRNNPTGWTYTNWEAAAKLSKNFTGYKVYIVECYNAEDEERFFKVGKTYVDVESRLYGKKAMPYAYTILKIIETTSAREACELEQELKNKHKEFKYIPKIKFGGMYECFHSLNIDLQTN